MKKCDEGAMLRPSGYCLCGDSIFFVQRDMNKLIEIDSNLKKIKMVKRLSNNIYGYPDVYNDFCVYANNQIYVFTNSSKDIHVLDLNKQEIETYSLMNNGISLIRAMYIEKSNILLLPYGGNQKICIDCNSKSCTYESIGNNVEVFLEKYYALEDKNYIFADSSGNNIHILDQKFNYLNSVQVGGDNSRYWGIVVIGDYYVLPQMDENRVTVYNKKAKEYVELDYPKNYVGRRGYRYSSMYAFGNKVYIFPTFANMILSVDVEHMTVRQAFAEESISVKYNETKTEIIAETYVDSFVVDDNVIVYEDMFGYWHKFNCRNNTVEVVELSKDQEQKYIDELRFVFSSNRLINEGVGLNSLENFIFSLNKE